MPNKPTTIPTLDTNQTNRTIPAPSKVTDGFTLNDILPAAAANYLWGWTGDWLTWLDATFSDGSLPGDIDVNGRVGIGKAPEFELDVVGTANVSSAYRIGGVNVLALDTGSLQIGAGAGVTNELLFYSGAGSLNMSLDASGQLGIGVDPSYKLDVAGSARFGTGPYISIPTGFANELNFSRGGANYMTATDALGELYFRTGGANNALGIDLNQNARFFGNVSIGAVPSDIYGLSLGRTTAGVSNEAGLYHVFRVLAATAVLQRNQYCYSKLDSASGIVSNFYGSESLFDKDGIGDCNTFVAYKATHDIDGTGVCVGVSSFRSSVNVGVGSTVTNLTHFIVDSLVSSGVVTNQYGLKIGSLTSAASNYGLYIEGANPGHAIWVDSGTCRFDDNVGIGVSPTYKLDVNGEIVSRAGTALRLRQSTYSVIHRNDNTYYYILVTASGDPDGTWTTKRPYVYTFATGDIYFSENVGIGVTPPTSKLHVDGVVKNKGLLTQPGTLSGITPTALVSIDQAADGPTLEFLGASSNYSSAGNIDWKSTKMGTTSNVAGRIYCIGDTTTVAGVVWRNEIRIAVPPLGGALQDVLNASVSTPLNSTSCPDDGFVAVNDSVAREFDLWDAGANDYYRVLNRSGTTLLIAQDTYWQSVEFRHMSSTLAIDDVSATGTPSTPAGWIKVAIGGTTRWIQTYSTAP